MVGPVVARGLHFHHVGELGRYGRRTRGAGGVGGGHDDYRRYRASAQAVAEEQTIVVTQQTGLAWRWRWAGQQRHGFAEAQGRAVTGLGKHFGTHASGCAAISGAIDFHLGLLTVVEHFAGQAEHVRLDRPGRPGDAQEVGVERTAGHRFVEVRVTDESFRGAGVRVHFGVRAVDAAQERSDGAIDGTGEIARCADADVAGDVDRAASGRGDIDRLDAIRVRDGIGAGNGYVHPDANPRKALLISIGRIFRGECRFDPGDISVHAITGSVVGNRGFGQEPEGFRRPVVREDHRLGVVVDTRLGQQNAHVGRRRGRGNARTGSTRLAQFHRQQIVVLIPHREFPGGEGVGAGVDGGELRIGTAGQRESEPERVERKAWPLVHDAS
ncbi:hypothetical protein D3C87_1062260 [compost metagenome]